MQILITANTFYPHSDGVARVAQHIAQSLAGENHEVHVATASVSGSPTAEQTPDGIQVHRFHVRGNQLTGIKGEAEKYVSFVQSRSWDLLILNCAQVWSSDLLTGLPSPHSCRKILFSHGLSAYPSAPDHPYFQSLARDLKSFHRVIALSHRLEEPEFCSRSALIRQ